MQGDRAHELRLVATLGDHVSLDAARAAVDATLGPGWTIERLLPDASTMLIRGSGSAPVGTVEHARTSHDAAVALDRSALFQRVEADVPIPAFTSPEDDDQNRSEAAPPLDWVHVLLHWQAALDLMPEHARGGRGVRIGHPDTGYTEHPNLTLQALDLTRDRDVIDGDDDAVDDLEQSPFWPLPFPGHGTATASVIVGHGPADSGITGLATGASLVPIRTTESVVQVFDSDVAKAVAHARRVGCQVISMSLGGKGLFGLETEIQHAVEDGIIVMAAAGNYVRVVTAPASYPSCIAVAATGPGDSPWEHSSRGRAVDVSMPGSQVYNARFREKQPYVGVGNGTSFAVAHLAAAAALWLAQHGREALVERYGAAQLQAAFLRTLRQPGACVVPDGWPAGWGIGRVDLLGLLRAPLPDLPESMPVTAPGDAASRIGYAIGADPAVVRTKLAELLHADDPARLSELVQIHEGELVYLAYTDAGFAEAVSSLAETGGPPVQSEGVSAELGYLLSR